MESQPLPGRKAEAARNDETILRAARAVFTHDPAATMAAVAAEAGVGVGALYRRYAGKDELLQRLCGDGLRTFTELAEAAAADDGDPWESFSGFVRGVVEADVHSLTVRLAGTFTTTEELRALAEHSNVVVARLFRRTRAAGVVRPDLEVNDLPMIFEQLTAVRGADPVTTSLLRRRYLTLQLDGISGGRTRLPGKPPTAEALGRRWRRPS